MRRRSDFEAAVRRGRRAGRDSLVLHVGRRGEAQPHGGGAPVAAPLVGLVVSRAVGSAVVRNRVKRRLRHLAASRLGVMPGNGVVVIRANPAAADRSSAELAVDLDAALSAASGGPGRPGRRA